MWTQFYYPFWLKVIFKKIGTPCTNGLRIIVVLLEQVTPYHSGKPWMADPAHPHYEATKKAIRHAYNMEPDLTREGGSIPVTLTFQVSVY